MKAAGSLFRKTAGSAKNECGPTALPLHIWYSKGRRCVVVTLAPGCTSRFGPLPPLYIYSKGKEVRGGHSYTRLHQSVGSNPPPLPLYIYSKGRRCVAVTRAPGCTSRFCPPLPLLVHAGRVGLFLNQAMCNADTIAVGY